MAYDEGLAQRVRDAMSATEGVIEKKMFGGLAFMVQGHMACGIRGEELMVRVGPEAYGAALERPHAREMDFTGRSLRGFVYVAPDGFESDQALDEWVQASVSFVTSLPPK